jgi:hypothetical protein
MKTRGSLPNLFFNGFKNQQYKKVRKLPATNKIFSVYYKSLNKYNIFYIFVSFGDFSS